MHTTQTGTTTFIHNSDMSGDITIVVGGNTIVVSGEDIIEFVGEYMKSLAIGEIEQKSGVNFITQKCTGIPTL